MHLPDGRAWPTLAAMRPIEFWYDFASPYAWLAATRIAALAPDAAWKPFLLGPILRHLSGTPWQQASDPERRYRRRDVERQAMARGLALVWPSAYPRGSLLATRIALIGASAGWGAEFSRAVFAANFTADRDIADPAVVADILARLGLAPALLDQAVMPETKAALVAQGQAALARGIFGAPSFVVGTELFWGNDRLDQAVAWR